MGALTALPRQDNSVRIEHVPGSKALERPPDGVKAATGFTA